MTIKATNDLMFKKLLASEENKDILQGFIKDFCGLDVPCDEIHIETPYSVEFYKKALGENKKRLYRIESDIAVELRSLNIIVELQMYRDDYFFARALYYTFERFIKNYGTPGKMVGTRAGKPDKYSSLKPVYAVNIVDGKLFQKDNDAIRTFTLYDTEHYSGLDKDWIRLSFLELDKAYIENTNQKYWHDFFSRGIVPSTAPAYIKRAQSVTDIINMDEEERSMLSTYEKNKAKHYSQYNTARREGKKEGIDALAKLIMQGVPLDEAVERAKETVETVEPSEDTD